MTGRQIKVVGVDLSLRSTGIARLTVSPDGVPSTYTTTVGRVGEDAETLRQRWLRLNWLVEAIAEEVAWPDLVLIEGPAYSAKYGHPHDRSGAWWQLVDILMSRGRCLVEVPPNVLKVWATGRGNTAKPAVTQRVAAHWGHLFDIPSGAGRSDVADAIAAVTLGAAHLGAPLIDLPPIHTRALASVQWPTNLTEGALL